MTVDHVRETAANYVDEHPLLSWCGVGIETLDQGTCTLSVPFDEKLTNPGPSDPGCVHGGVLSTLAETSGGIALATLVRDPNPGDVVTTDLSLSFVRPATEDVRARAEVVRAGGSVGSVDLEVECGPEDSGRQVVATGTGTYRLFRGDRD